MSLKTSFQSKLDTQCNIDTFLTLPAYILFVQIKPNLDLLHRALSQNATPKAIILDLWDLLIPRPSLPTSTRIPRHIIRESLDSDIWASHERGEASESMTCQSIAWRYILDIEDVMDIVRQARVQGVMDQDVYMHVVENLRALKREVQAAAAHAAAGGEGKGEGESEGIVLCAMLNIPAPTAGCEALRKIIADWVGDENVFDHVFLSHEVGTRKPDRCFYGHVLSELGLSDSVEKALFVGSSTEDVLAAKSMGARVILHSENAENTLRLIQNALGDGVDELVSFMEGSRTWNFLQDVPQSSISTYPDDFDTTALALTVLDREEKVVHPITDEMASHVSVDGIVLTYFDRSRLRVDPIVCINVLRLFHKYGRGSELAETLSWVRDVLRTRAYIDGTRYYATPEAFLYTLSRLLQCTEGHELEGHAEFVSLLRSLTPRSRSCIRRYSPSSK
ncbi:hypothetical protein BDW74DRAFT_177722 [Aspergillus multicolor]|uniref:HAD family hydrolase n=1 Tax=Aspergillus multicolor TaxID=41759 RepID=UPI003CCE4C26